MTTITTTTNIIVELTALLEKTVLLPETLNSLINKADNETTLGIKMPANNWKQ